MSFHGLLIVDKEAGCTSHDVVKLARRAYGTRSVGHAGTLDPMATGVLVLAIGEATKRIHSARELSWDQAPAELSKLIVDYVSASANIIAPKLAQRVMTETDVKKIFGFSGASGWFFEFSSCKDASDTDIAERCKALRSIDHQFCMSRASTIPHYAE